MSKPIWTSAATPERTALLIFLQMLPATLLTPAIRPLFQDLHAGRESAMHAFMALNMLGGILAAPWLGRVADRRGHPSSLVAALAAADAVLLALLVQPLATTAVLGLRVLEGAAHVGASTLLLARAAALGRARGNGRAMGWAGTGLMMAVALGSAIGGAALSFGARAPFFLAALLSLAVAFSLVREGGVPGPKLPRRVGVPWTMLTRRLAVPVAACFVERFSVGCIVVTFALFAHRAHGIPDATVGYLFCCLTLPFALLMYPVSRLGERVPRAALLAGGGLLYAAALAGLGLVPAGGLGPTMLAAGIGSALMFAPTLGYAAALAGRRRRGRAMALVNAAGCLGMLLGPAVAGMASATLRTAFEPSTAYRAVFGLAGTCVLLWVFASAPWLARRYRQEGEARPHPLRVRLGGGALAAGAP